MGTNEVRGCEHPDEGAVRHRLLLEPAVPLAAAVAAATAPAAHHQPPLRLHTLKVIDPVSGNVEAFRMLVPDGWVRTGGVAWSLRYSNVASVMMQVRNPHAPEALESFPLIPQVWENSGIAGIGVGQNYLGMEVRARSR